MFRLEGTWFGGVHPVGSRATLIWAGATAALVGERAGGRYAIRELRASPPLDGAERFIVFPDGGQFLCADGPQLAAIPQEVRSEGPVAWLERHWSVALVCIVLVFGLLGAGYRWGLPAAAEAVAQRIPIETEAGIGREALAWFDDGWFTPSEVSPESRAAIAEAFARLHRDLPTSPRLRLEFRSTFLGANAFALPGGTIVLTDEMVLQANSLEELLTVLAHEAGHVERRHVIRMILQSSAVGIVAATLTADAATLTSAVAGIPFLLAQARYSREMETEADDFAFDLLRRHGLSPEHFATLMERLAKAHPGEERRFAYISSHPETDERVRRAREAPRPASGPAPVTVLPEQTEEARKAREEKHPRRGAECK